MNLRRSFPASAVPSFGSLRLGDRLTLDGAEYVVRGFDPIGVESPRLHVEPAREREPASVGGALVLIER